MLFRTISTLLPAVKEATLSALDVQIKGSTNYRKSKSHKTATLDAAAILLVRNHEVVSVISQTLSKPSRSTGRESGVSIIALTANNNIGETSTHYGGSSGDDNGSPRKYRATRNPDREGRSKYLDCQIGSAFTISIPILKTPMGFSQELCRKSGMLLSYLEKNLNEWALTSLYQLRYGSR